VEKCLPLLLRGTPVALRGIVERFEQFFPARLMGTANEKLVEQHFYGLIISDGVLMRMPSHGISSCYFRVHFIAYPQFDDVAVAGRFIEVHAHPGQSPSDLLIRPAAMMEEGGYRESDFPEPNWEWLANEERVFSPGVQRN
jgi:hypothetical protein